MFMLNYATIDALAALCNIFFDGDGCYKKFISCNYLGEEEEEYLPISDFEVKEDLENLLDTNPEAAGEVGLTIEEALDLVERFAAAIEG